MSYSQLMDEMRAKELKPTKNTYLAALNAMAESARVDESWALINEMQANGIPPDEFAYTAIINGYKRAVPVSAPALCCWQGLQLVSARASSRQACIHMAVWQSLGAHSCSHLCCQMCVQGGFEHSQSVCAAFKHLQSVRPNV